MSIAFLFPGQGSQSVGMLDAIADLDRVQETFTEASAAAGIDLWRLASEGPEAELNLTVNTQPALLAAEVAIWRVWRERGGAEPSVLAGHSLGEYSALVCAGAIDLEAAVRLVRNRGTYMQSAVPDGAGAMAAILGLDDGAVEEACAVAAQGEIVSAANFNCPGQVVIAGHAAAVKRAIAAAQEAGAKRAILLPVSVPSHCELMRPAAEALRRDLEAVRLREARIPVIQNVDAEPRRDAEGIRRSLVEQLCRPVQWVQCTRRMRSLGVDRAVECGPGKVLAGLVKRIEPEIAVIPGAEPGAIPQKGGLPT
ncbi:MAG TPA: ACP S-malonyltransferase [Gammaproteobacteria bacterium]|jgi:[acyl-carrier-protein] S-malonyltransferase